MSGECSCGVFLWFTTHEANESKHDTKMIDSLQPNGVLTCNGCGKPYTEDEFREIKDMRDYGLPSETYEESIAEGYKHFTKRRDSDV